MENEYLESVTKQFEYYKLLGGKTFNQLTEEQLFWKYNDESNSIATIVKHLWGNMLSRWTDFLTTDGEKEWRQRDAEFENDINSRDEMSLKWEQGWSCLFNALSSINDQNKDAVIYIRNQGHSITEAINRQLAHYSYHIGQIVFIGKMLNNQAWNSLSIPKGNSKNYNQEKFSKPKEKTHFTDEYLEKGNANKQHWETIYNEKSPDEVSWTQIKPTSSLKLLTDLQLNKSSSIIDVGGGDSLLVDNLLDLGYSDITVLDISEKAIERAKKRLGDKANKVNWIVSDVLDFVPDRSYQLWHDRAAFHFLTEDNQVQQYLNKIKCSKVQSIVLGTFSTNGPKKCSGLEIKQYNKEALELLFSKEFVLLDALIEQHKTPFDTVQEFVFVSLQKK